MLVNRPGEIDNSALVALCGAVKTSVVEKDDFVVLGEDAWTLLHKWYVLSVLLIIATPVNFGTFVLAPVAFTT